MIRMRGPVIASSMEAKGKPGSLITKLNTPFSFNDSFLYYRLLLTVIILHSTVSLWRNKLLLGRFSSIGSSIREESVVEGCRMC